MEKWKARGRKMGFFDKMTGALGSAGKDVAKIARDDGEGMSVKKEFLLHK